MSIKKLQRKSRQPSNLTIRMSDDRMATDRMSEMRGPGGTVQRPSATLAGQDNSLQRSEDVHQEASTENK